MTFTHNMIAALALMAGSINAMAAATLYDGAFTVGSTGAVEATFLGHTAAYSNDLYFSTDNISWSFIFNNHATPWGQTVSLGSFDAGTELFFKIHVNNTATTFYSGAASNNPDGLVHVVAETTGLDTYVGFEDLYGGGDMDYDDVRYSFRNVAAVPVPEPETYALMLGGLGVAALAARRRQRREAAR